MRRLAGATVVLIGVAVAAASAVLASGCRRAPLPTSREGRALYAENGCASCHGHSGFGDGPVAATLEPRPRNFRDASAFKNGVDVQAIATTIADGIPVSAAPVPDRVPTYSGSLGPALGGPPPAPADRVAATGAPGQHQQGMPKFPHLSDVERQSLALYVISLRSQSR